MGRPKKETVDNSVDTVDKSKETEQKTARKTKNNSVCKTANMVATKFQQFAFYGLYPARRARFALRG